MNRGEIFDLAVIGGGINGVGIARDAAGRGLSVLLCERDDLASGTSSVSSKLIHGGLRYLEYFELRLVREALGEREVLMRIAPHLIRPMRFVLPHDRVLRPAWMIRAGLFLYDHLSHRRQLQGSQGLNLRQHPAGASLRNHFRKGFAYSDCWVDDSRLVVLNAVDAARRGATILLQSPCVGARREDGLWTVSLRESEGVQRDVRAKMLVNATGPWLSQVNTGVLRQKDSGHLTLVKGSHIVVPRLYEGDHAYILQNEDKRVIFVLPFLEHFSLIGTTDVPFRGDPAQVAVDPEEVEYLCHGVNRYFRKAVRPEDVVWQFSGVRPLFNDASDDPSAVTREYVLEWEDERGKAPLLSVIGGKITAYRQVAEHALERMGEFFPNLPAPWTGGMPLPGGDIPRGRFDLFFENLSGEYPWLPEAMLLRLARAYGTMTRDILAHASSEEDLGRHFGGGLYEREVEHLLEHEFARSGKDILWRRSKLGLFLTPSEHNDLSSWVTSRLDRAGRMSGLGE